MSDIFSAYRMYIYTHLVALQLKVNIIMLVWPVWGRFPVKLGPGAGSAGSGLTNGVQRI